MDGSEAVLDSPEIESGVDSEVDGTAGQKQDEDGEGGQQKLQTDDPYSPKGSREYSKWLNGLRDTDPGNAKYARLAKDDHSRLYALQQLEPNGIDGVREKYALLDSVAHGELRGMDAVSAIQDELRNVAEVDELLAQGDPRALEFLGDDFNDGLVKLAPHILDRVAQVSPEAYADAILPHTIRMIAQSPVLQNYNAAVDILSEKAPDWLPNDRQSAWAADRMNRLVQTLAPIGQWINDQGKKIDGKQIQQPNGRLSTQQGNDLANDRLAQADRREQDFHWKTNIFPETNKHAVTKFLELFKPFEKRLRLPQETKQALLNDFVGEITKKMTTGVANGSKSAYAQQIARYYAQKNPDPRTVANYFKVEFDKHAKTVMDGLIKQRYGSFLQGKPKTATPAASSSSASGKGKPVGPNVQIVSVKPTDIDHKNTPLEWIHQKKYRLNDGRIVQVRQ